MCCAPTGGPDGMSVPAFTLFDISLAGERVWYWIAGAALLLVPEVYWDYCAQDVMVMQRMHGTPISQVAKLREQGVDIALSREPDADGVELLELPPRLLGLPAHADMLERVRQRAQ